MNKTLSAQEIADLLAERHAWSMQNGMLVRHWHFPSFSQAIKFVIQIAGLAEQADHHPDIDIRYRDVRLALISHDVGALTPRDAAMVRQIDEIFPS